VQARGGHVGADGLVLRPRHGRSAAPLRLRGGGGGEAGGRGKP
jgi:hypothetical protein